MPKTVICLTLRASDWLRGWLIASHALPLFFLCLHRPEPLSFLFAIPAFLLWRRSMRLLGLAGLPDDVIEIKFDDDHWGLTLRSGERLVVDLHHNSGFFSFWQFLLFKSEDGKLYRVLVFRDSMDPESFRKLRMLLRFRKKNAGFRF